VGTVADEQRPDSLQLLTAIKNFLEIDGANLMTHPVCSALQKAAIVRFNGDFIFPTADAINSMTHETPAGAKVKLEMVFWVVTSFETKKGCYAIIAMHPQSTLKRDLRTIDGSLVLGLSQPLHH